MSFSRRVAATLALSAYVLMGGTARSWILCLGSDGHVTVELTGSTCCQGSGLTKDRGDLGPAASLLVSSEGAGGCGACLDVPLFAAETPRADVLKLKDQDATAVALSLLCAPSILVAGPNVVVASERDDHTLRRDRTLSHLRTVVLRC
jgi:hypothetical protein